MRPAMLSSLATLRAVRTALVDTVAGLDEETFETGPTLCAGWAPRDVLAHNVQLQHPLPYLARIWRMNRLNADNVAIGRTWDRAELLSRARAWAEVPGTVDRITGRVLGGDVSMHHRDITRALGIERSLGQVEEDLIFWEGVALTIEKAQPTLLRYRVEPTNGRGCALGCGRVVRGTAEALGMWLGGRAVDDVEIGA